MFRFVKENKAKCLHCTDVLISEPNSASKVVSCRCGRLRISGGATSMVRSGILGRDYQELSKLSFDKECPAVKEDVQDPPPDQDKILNGLKNSRRK